MRPEAPDDLWEQIDGLTAGMFPNDPGFTISEFAERYGIQYDAAYNKIKEMVHAKKLIEGKAIKKGRRRPVFRPAE